MVLVLAASVIVAGPGAARRRAPSALLTLITGIVTSVFSPRVPPIFSSSTLLATIIATAPSFVAMACFSEKGQLPRSTSTTDPLTGKPS